MVEDKHNRSDDWHIPRDWAFILGHFGAILPAIFLIPYLLAARRYGDTSLFRAGLLLGAIGVGLLVVARWPLYRKRRFFTFGSRALSGIHRKLYNAAYIFIGLSLLLLGLLVLLVR